jgi:hypothetical protein
MTPETLIDILRGALQVAGTVAGPIISVRSGCRSRSQYFSGDDANQRFYPGIRAESPGDDSRPDSFWLVDVADVSQFHAANDHQSPGFNELTTGAT